MHTLDEKPEQKKKKLEIIRINQLQVNTDNFDEAVDKVRMKLKTGDQLTIVVRRNDGEHDPGETPANNVNDYTKLSGSQKLTPTQQALQDEWMKRI